MGIPKDGDTCLIVASPAYRDTIYVGRLVRDREWIGLRDAVNIIYYEEVAPGGLTSQPEKATRKAPVTGGDRTWWVPVRAVSALLKCDAGAWEPHLSKGEG